jgi:two-component sensor histidine kinase/PAS domain-containing protein
MLATLKHDATYQGETPSSAHRREDMAQVSPISPLTHAKDCTATLEDVLMTPELFRRPTRAPNHASENGTLVSLAQAMALNPCPLLQTLVDQAVDLCRAGTAGISVLKSDADGECLTWEALSGVLAPYARISIPRHFSLCGTTLDRQGPQLFAYPARYFTYLTQIDAPIVEALVVPLYVSSRSHGTLWILAHDATRQFDAEDVRLLTNLAAFASAALQVASGPDGRSQGNQLWDAREASQPVVPSTYVIGAARPPRSSDAVQRTGEWQFQRLLEKLPAAAYTCDRDGLITYFNPQAEKLWGRAPKLQDPVDRFCGSFKLYATDGTPIAHDACWMALALKMNQEYNGHEIIIEHPDGQRLTALAYANPMHDEAGTLVGAVNVLVDITERKQAEEQLQASLHEKEVLLKEIHHRVKNNLQVIASLLYLQSDQLKDPQDVALFEDTQNRVKSMALVHESLYRTGDLARFNFAHYIESLATHLFKSHVAEGSRISLNMELDEIAFDVDTAVPCGLILNELLTNALKYAFPDGRSGTIQITLQAAAERVMLRVRDTGVGFPEGFDFRNAESLGLQLVGMMTEQLGGTLTLTCKGGTTFTVSIPYPTR